MSKLKLDVFLHSPPVVATIWFLLGGPFFYLIFPGSIFVTVWSLPMAVLTIGYILFFNLTKKNPLPFLGFSLFYLIPAMLGALCVVVNSSGKSLANLVVVPPFCSLVFSGVCYWDLKSRFPSKVRIRLILACSVFSMLAWTLVPLIRE